jgi:hypothetical protein
MVRIEVAQLSIDGYMDNFQPWPTFTLEAKVGQIHHNAVVGWSGGSDC